MAYGDTTGRQLVAHIDRLDALVKQVANSTHWQARNRPVTWHAGTFVQRLLAHLVSADGGIGFDELRLLHAQHGDDLTVTEEHEWVRATVEEHPDLPVAAPDFFLAACRHDRAQGSRIAAVMLSEIAGICRLVSCADGTVQMAEKSVAGTLLHTLAMTQMQVVESDAPAS